MPRIAPRPPRAAGVALREFHKRIPEYGLAEGTVLEYTPGLRSLNTLPIVFDPA